MKKASPKASAKGGQPRSGALPDSPSTMLRIAMGGARVASIAKRNKMRGKKGKR